MEDTLFPTPCPMRSRPHFSHRPSAFHNPFQPTCGSRGKHRTPYPHFNLFIQNSRYPQPRFGKLRTSPTPPQTTTSEAFPLFLHERLVLLSFLLLFLPFSSTRRAFFHLWNQSPLSTLLIPLAASKLAQRLNQSTLSREAARFSTHAQTKG